MEQKKSSQKNIGIIIGILVLVAILLIAIFSGKKQPVVDTGIPNTPVVPSDTTSQLPPADTTKNQTAASIYKDGTYSATGSYMSPGGPDKIGVSVTLVHDIITDVSVTPMPGDPRSAGFQDMFASAYKSFVVGKNINDVHLTKVSGSSLTGAGFNDALAQIKAQAKA